MWAPRRLSRAGLTLALLLLAAPARGQGLFQEVPPEYSNGPVTGEGGWATVDERDSSPYHRARLRDALAPVIERGGALAAARELVQTFREDSWPAQHAGELERILRELDDFLADFEVALTAPGIEGLVDDEVEQGIFLDAFRDLGRGPETLRPSLRLVDETPTLVWFSGEGDPRAGLLLYEYDEEASERLDDDLYRTLLPSELARRWRLLEDTLSQLLEDQVALLRARNVSDLERAVERWENYLDHGYSQYPWESLANGWLLELPELGPPQRQWILFHPTLGVEAGGSIDELRIKETLCLELVGHLWYTEERDDYYGLSLTANLREDLDPGLGALLHFRRNWNLGVAWHDHEDDPFLFLSLDLYSFARSRHQRYETRLRELEGQIEALR